MADAEYKRLTVGASLFSSNEKVCAVEGCGRQAAARGWCKMHWARWKKHGDPLGGNWDKPKLAQFCEIDGCDREARSHWDMTVSVCAMHYLRKLQTGSFDPPNVVQSPDGLCLLDGCNSPIRGVFAKYCERHYYQLRRNGEFITTVVDGVVVPVDIPEYEHCVYCGKPSEGQRYCSPRCAARFNRGLPKTLECRQCGSEFEPVNGAVCCSEACTLRYQRTWSLEYYKQQMETSPDFRARMRHAQYKRKALKTNAFVEHVDRDLVMERDGWVCYLCGGEIPQDVKWPHGLFGTLEHVLPLSRGGEHSYSNVKAAHLSCNCSKGTKTVDQLGLLV